MDILKYFSRPEIIVLIIGGFFLTFLAFLERLLNKERIPKYISWGIFVSGLIVIFSGLLTGYNNEKTSKLLQLKSDKIEELSEKNVNLAKRNAELIKQNKDILTGGDSYVVVLPVNPPAGSNMIKFVIYHRGEYPVYDVFIRILDYSKFNKMDIDRELQDVDDQFLQDELYEKLREKAEIRLDAGNIIPGTAKIAGLYKISAAEFDELIQLYYVQVIARNGTLYEVIKTAKIDGKWIISYKVFTYLFPNDVEILMEHEEFELPLDVNFQSVTHLF